MLAEPDKHGLPAPSPGFRRIPSTRKDQNKKIPSITREFHVLCNHSGNTAPSAAVAPAAPPLAAYNVPNFIQYFSIRELF